MTTPPLLDPDGLPPLWDQGNTLLQTGLPSMILVGKVPLPGGGEIGIATIRTQTATMTISGDSQAVQEWSETFAELARSLTGTGLIVPGRGQAAAISQAVTQANRSANGQQ